MPALNDQRRRLEAIVARQEATIRNAFLTFTNEVSSERVMKQVADLLQARNIEGALNIVDSYIVRAGSAIPKVMTRGIEHQVQELSRQLADRTHMALSFDHGNLRAAELMRQNTLRFVRGLSQQQRVVTREAIAYGLSGGFNVPSMAREFRDSIGLTINQRRSVQRYTDLLSQGSSEATQRQLRDRRFDSTVQTAIEESEPLSVSQIERMTSRYRANMVNARAETIARTESARATNLASLESTRQVADQLQIDPDQIIRTWHATQDARTRDTHAEMDGQEVGLDEPFLSSSGAEIMYPGDPDAPAEETINCRCVITTSIQGSIE